MGKHILLKRAAAGLLAAALAFAGPGFGGLLAKDSILTVSAAEGDYNIFWESGSRNSSETIVGNVGMKKDQIVKIGDTYRCGIKIDGSFAVGEDSELHLYNSSYLFITGTLELFKNARIVCEDNSKIVLHSSNIDAHGAYSISDNDFVVTAADEIWNARNINQTATYTGDICMLPGSEINICNHSLITIDGNLEINADLNIEEGSYLFVKKGVKVRSNARINCGGISRILLYSDTNTVPVMIYGSPDVKAEDFVGTNLQTLEYLRDEYPAKDYFKSGGKYYTFDGSRFRVTEENSKTRCLKNLCTAHDEEYGILFSEAAYQAYQNAMDTKELSVGLKGYTMDGETCDDMFMTAGDYDRIIYNNYFARIFSRRFEYGTSYIITENEVQNVVTAPCMTNMQAHIGDYLDLYFEFDEVSEDTVNDFRVVLSGNCNEDGVEQSIVYDERFGAYAVKATFSANQIGEKITGRIYYNGIEVGEPFTWSFEEYLGNLSNQSQRLKPVCEAIMFYGKTAANYFDDKNIDVSAAVAAYKNTYGLNADTVSDTLEPYKPSFSSEQAKLALVLDSAAAVRLYISGMDENAIVTDTQGNVIYQAQKDRNGWYFEVDGVTPLGMMNQIPFGSYKFSCCSWVYRVLTNPDYAQDTELTDLAVGIYAYVKSVYDYVHPN